MQATEAEMKTKTCPIMSRPESLVTCRGSECALWEWGSVRDVKPDYPGAMTAAEVGIHPSFVDPASPRRFAPREGTCGLKRPEKSLFGI